MADTILYLRDPVFSPAEHTAMTLVAMQHNVGGAVCTFDVVDDNGVFKVVEQARASGRLLELGMYRAPSTKSGEVKVLMTGRMHGHWPLPDTRPVLRTLSFRLTGPMRHLRIDSACDPSKG